MPELTTLLCCVLLLLLLLLAFSAGVPGKPGESIAACDTSSFATALVKLVSLDCL
jgi:hypothetical protein